MQIHKLQGGGAESANKLVVEARLKGSGMHSARPHVDAMLALRNIACNDRWDEAWPQIATALRYQAQQHRIIRRRQHHPALSSPLLVAQPEPLSSPALAHSHTPPSSAPADHGTPTDFSSARV